MARHAWLWFSGHCQQILRLGFTVLKGSALEIGDTRGCLIEADAGVQYQISQDFGIGGGIKWFFLDVRKDETERVDVEWDFDLVGPAVTLPPF